MDYEFIRLIGAVGLFTGLILMVIAGCIKVK